MTNGCFWVFREYKCLKKVSKAIYAGDFKRSARYKKLARRARKKRYFMNFYELVAEHKTQR